MRLLADENFPLPSIARLRAAGFDVAAVAEEARGATDLDVIRRARDEERILITFDRDFGELIYLKGESPPPGVIYFRLIPDHPEEPADLLVEAIRTAGLEPVGKFSVLRRDHVRQRDLPAEA
jgi:predicted nuclease of predicted toxin-antitoxin system